MGGIEMLALGRAADEVRERLPLASQAKGGNFTFVAALFYTVNVTTVYD